MSVPFYVSPEQIMRDKADFARKGIARGRSVDRDAVRRAASSSSPRTRRGPCTRSARLYDRIGFAAVGKYNEFESLRVAGVRLADMRGYSYDRSDVTGRSLANAYAQTLGTIFTETTKPFEVEIVVAEVGARPADDQLYRLMFDGSVADERGYVAMGGSADAIVDRPRRAAGTPGMTLGECVTVAVRLLGEHGDGRATRPRRRAARGRRPRPVAAPAHLPAAVERATAARNSLDCSRWTAGSSASRPSTGSRARSTASAG